MWFYMKKELKKGLLLALMAAVSTVASAQVTHFIGGWVQGGEYSLFSNVDRTALNLRPSLGGGVGIGFNYELRAGHFLLDAGVGTNTGWTRFNVPDHEVTIPNQIDRNGDRFDYVYTLNHRKDAYWNSSLQVPLMVGGQWKKFYFLVGGKFDWAYRTLTYTKAAINTAGVYKTFPPKTETNDQMHGFVTNFPWVMMDTIMKPFEPNVTLSMEIGMRLGEVFEGRGFDIPDPKVQYRLALFADFGLLDIHHKPMNPGTEGLLWTVPDKYSDMPFTPYGIHSQDVMHSREAANAGKVKEGETPTARFNSFMVGVKFTILFRLPQKKICLSCKDEPFRSSYGILE